MAHRMNMIGTRARLLSAFAWMVRVMAYGPRTRELYRPVI